MAQITITIDDADVPWMKQGLARKWGYQDEIDNQSFDPGLPEDPITNPLKVPNPESIVEFLKRQLIVYIRTEATIGHNALANDSNSIAGENLNIT